LLLQIRFEFFQTLSETHGLGPTTRKARKLAVRFGAMIQNGTGLDGAGLGHSAMNLTSALARLQ
jgi:hypothetical protein